MKVPLRVWQKTWRHARPTTGQKTCHGQWQSGGLRGNGEGRMGNLVGRVCLAGKLFCLLVPFHVWVGVVLCVASLCYRYFSLGTAIARPCFWLFPVSSRSTVSMENVLFGVAKVEANLFNSLQQNYYPSLKFALNHTDSLSISLKFVYYQLIKNYTWKNLWV